MKCPYCRNDSKADDICSYCKASLEILKKENKEKKQDNKKLTQEEE